MAIRIVRLGTPRAEGEGIRLGTVRRPPRGVSRSDYSRLNYFDVWLPELGPSPALLSWARSKPWTEQRWATFARRYRAEMAKAPLSRDASISVGCFCEDQDRCHRSLLRELLVQAGADLA
jgi:uncharacterized protein YeaO (DUF488 family)